MRIGDLLDGEYLLDEIIIISRALGKDKAWVLSHLDDELPEEIFKRVADMIELRRSGYPLHYITGVREFMGMEFLVREGVFIPRVETETLVEIALDLIENIGAKLVAEIGVGSGVISISLAKIAGVRVIGTDVNGRAIDLAMENAERLGVKELVDFKRGEFLEPFSELFGEIDLVVSNPPYVENSYNPPPDVLKEPKEAIFSGKDGMDFIREYFKRYGRSWPTVMEFSGKEHAKEIVKSLCDDVKFYRDLDDVERFFFCSSEFV